MADVTDGRRSFDREIAIRSHLLHTNLLGMTAYRDEDVLLLLMDLEHSADSRPHSAKRHRDVTQPIGRKPP